MQKCVFDFIQTIFGVHINSAISYLRVTFLLSTLNILCIPWTKHYISGKSDFSRTVRWKWWEGNILFTKIAQLGCNFIAPGRRFQKLDTRQINAHWASKVGRTCWRKAINTGTPDPWHRMFVNPEAHIQKCQGNPIIQNKHEYE